VTLTCVNLACVPGHSCDPQGKLEELEAEIMEVNGNSERLARSYNELVELQLVLERAGSFFDQVGVVERGGGGGGAGASLTAVQHLGSVMSAQSSTWGQALCSWCWSALAVAVTSSCSE
jgi:hypothetical protein